MGKTIKYIIAVLALPLAVGFSKAFYQQLATVGYMSDRLHYFLWGIVIYMLIHILFYKPVYLYTLGHEMIHVVATWVCGGHVTSFHVSNTGGSVSTSKSNIFIELSPYFVPIYTIILISLIPVLRYRLSEVNLFSVYLMLIGFSLGMHLIMNAYVMKMRQPDLAKSGYAFSLILVYIANLLIVFFLLTLLMSDLSFKVYFLKSVSYARDIYFAVYRKIFLGV